MTGPPSTPPPQPPPAGWYSDPDGASLLRWWDGERWTEHVSASEPPSEGQPPAGVTAAGGGQQPGKTRSVFRRHSRARILTAAVVVVLAAVAVIALVTSGDDSQAAYAECRRDAQPVLAAMQSLGSHLDVGLVQSDYGSEVGDVQATYDRMTGKHPATPCQPVVAALGEAMEAYATASSEWNECIFSEEEGECPGGTVQQLWSNADQAIASARQRLSSLSGGGDAVAAAESEAAQTEADALAKEEIRTAEVAMETYATEHNGSYDFATPPELRKIEPTLPSTLKVSVAGPDFFSISVASKGGNRFEISREVGGGMAFNCGKAGNAGCPASGEWG